VEKFESHNDKLPEILDKFRGITKHFEDGHYKKMIVGELQKNHMQINDMHTKLFQEMQENEPLKNKIKALELESDVLSIFDEVRN
jgi:hypothetical protein